MRSARTPRSAPAVVVRVFGPPTVPLVSALWSLGLRPMAATVGPTVWMPPPTRREGES